MEDAGLSVGLMYGNGGGQAASTAGGNATQPNAPKTNPVEVALQQQALGLQLKQIEAQNKLANAETTKTLAENTIQGHKQFNIADDLQTGTLADYLGVPTTITGTFGTSVFQLPDKPLIQQQTVNALTKEKGYNFPYHTITYSTWEELGDKWKTINFSDLFQASTASLVGQPTPELYAFVFKYTGVSSTTSPNLVS